MSIIAPSLLAPERNAPRPNESNAADPSKASATHAMFKKGEGKPFGDHSEG